VRFYVSLFAEKKKKEKKKEKKRNNSTEKNSLALNLQVFNQSTN